MNQDLVTITAVTDVRGAPATRVALRTNDRYALTVPDIHSAAQIPAPAAEWLEFAADALANHTTVGAALQALVKQKDPSRHWPKTTAVDGWYELVVGAPLIIGSHAAVVQAQAYLADKGWNHDQAGRFHWPEAHGALHADHFMEHFRTDAVLRVLPVQFGLSTTPNSVSDTVLLCKDFPIEALIDPFIGNQAAVNQLSRELAGHRLTAKIYRSTDFINPVTTGPAAVVEKALAAFDQGSGPVLLDDPFMPWGWSAAVARGVYASGLIAGAIMDPEKSPYVVNGDL